MPATTAPPSYGRRIAEQLAAPFRQRRATQAFIVLTAAACGASFFAFLALLNVTGILTHVGAWALPPMAFIDLLGLAFVAFAVPYGYLEFLSLIHI